MIEKEELLDALSINHFDKEVFKNATLDCIKSYGEDTILSISKLSKKYNIINNDNDAYIHEDIIKDYLLWNFVGMFVGANTYDEMINRFDYIEDVVANKSRDDIAALVDEYIHLQQTFSDDNLFYQDDPNKEFKPVTYEIVKNV